LTQSASAGTRAVLRVRAAGLEGHRRGLPSGVHDRLGDLGRARVEPGEDLEHHRRAGLDAGVAPGGDRGGHRREEHVDVRTRVGDPQLGTERRALGADPLQRARLLDREGLAQAGLEGGAAVGAGILAVGLGRLRERRPVAALLDRRQRGLEGRSVALLQVGDGRHGLDIGHGGSSASLGGPSLTSDRSVV
jgi:hypothetical protein